MPAFKLTTKLHVVSKIDDNVLKSVRDQSNQDDLCRQLLILLQAENAKEQIDKLKQGLKEIRNRTETVPVTDERVACPLHFLVHFFFIATTKNPCRRLLISFFQGLTPEIQTASLVPLITSALLKLFQETVCSGTQDDPAPDHDQEPVQTASHMVSDRETSGDAACSDKDQVEEQRHAVDTVLALLENFPLGERCVSDVALEAICFLTQVQKYFYSLYSPQLSPVEQNETMHHCLATVKVINRVCQRSSPRLHARLQDEANKQVYVRSASTLIQTDVNILLTDDFLLDCKTTSAMNICLMVRLGLDEETLLNLLAHTVFQHIGWFKETHIQKELPCWLSELSLDQLAKSSLTSSSYLSVCYGILAMVSMEMLTRSLDGKCLLLDLLLNEFLLLSKSCSDVGSKLLAAKAVLFLTQRLKTHSRGGALDQVDVSLLPRLPGDSADMQKILDFVWTSWEDTVDAVRFTVKDVFNNIVSLHVSVAQTGTVQEDPFLLELTHSILTNVSWSCKGKYGTLSVLVSHLGSARMLQTHDGIATEVLTQLQEQTLACYAGDLYESLFQRHLLELTGTGSVSGTQHKGDSDMMNDIEPGTRQWLAHWVEPVLWVLCGEDTVHKKHVIEYILPKLLKTGEKTLAYMIKYQTNMLMQSCPSSQDSSISKRFTKGNQLGALIMCLRRARALGQLNKSLAASHIKKKTTSEKMVSQDVTMTKDERASIDQERECGDVYKDIEGGVEQSVSITQLWGVVDVSLIEQALICKDEQVRLDGFALLCENQKTTDPVSGEELRLVLAFIPQNLNNQNPAFRQHFISLLKKFLYRIKESSLTLKKLAKKKEENQHYLDSYKTMLEDLTRCLFSSLYPGSVFSRRTTCLGALSLLMEVYGPSEQHGTEYNFYSLMSAREVHSLLLCLTDTFEDNKLDAMKILVACSESPQGTPVLDPPLTEEVTQIALTLSQSPRPQDGCTAAYMFRVLLHQPAISTVLKSMLVNQDFLSKERDQEEGTPHKKVKDPDNGLFDVMKDDLSGRQFRLLWLLLQSLEDQTRVAKSSLMVAAANRPMYPTLQCIRYCLTDVSFRYLENPDAWNMFLGRFISLCFTISEIVSPVVHNSSPEGNVPMAEVEGEGDLSSVASQDEVSRSRETVMLMPEYLVVCCWRSVKEVSLILGQLTSRVPALDTGHHLLTVAQILQIGDYFTTQLLESKHRGAFELAYAGFVMVTEMLWRSSDPLLHRLPAQWLAHVMADIRSGDPDSRLCATRRSAGVPFYVQALVTTEPTSTGRTCFKRTMNDLLALAFDETVVSQEMSTPKVHALNILRALYKDSRLKDDVSPYVADGLQVAILGFKSPLWVVRNSATLLMSAMMVRIFGVKRSKDETSFSRKNCQTGRTFFHKYPTLYQFLLTELQEATEQITSQLHPGLYPILMVLGRLFPSAMEGTDTNLNLAAFIPYVVKCSSSPVLKTRVMASRALQPLVEKDHVTSVFTDLLTLLPCQSSETYKQNQIHGTLLQIQQMFYTVPSLSPGQLDMLSQTILDLWSQKVNTLVSRQNTCVLTRAEALKVSSDILLLFGPHQYIEQTLTDTLQLEMLDFPQLTTFDPCTPALNQFHMTICNLYMQKVLPAAADKPVKSHVTGSAWDHVTGSYVNDGIQNSKQLVTVNDKQNMGANGDVHTLNHSRVGSFPSKSAYGLEDVLVKLLCSSAYEVRETILQELTDVCISNGAESSTTDSLQVQAECDMSASNRQSCPELYKCLQRSERVYTTLTELISTEVREECLVQLFRLLNVLPRNSCYQDNSVSQLISSLQQLMEKIQSPEASEPVRAALIEYSGTLAGYLYSQTQPALKDHAESADCSHLPIEDTLTQWAAVIKGHCAGDGGTEIKLACAYSLRNIVNKTWWSSENSLTCVAMESVLDLLHGDHLEVREAAAEIVFNLLFVQSGVPPQPYVCVDMLLKHWTQLGFHGNSKLKVIQSLLMMIGDSREKEDQEVEERLFDRGEGNTYWDELDYIKSLDKAVMEYCSPLEETKTMGAEVVPVKDGCLTSLVTDQVNKLLSDADSELKSLSDKDLKYMFVYPPSFQQDVIRLYKRLLIVRYGVGWSQDTECVDRCLQWADKLRSCVKNEYLPHKLVEVMESIGKQ